MRASRLEPSRWGTSLGTWAGSRAKLGLASDESGHFYIGRSRGLPLAPGEGTAVVSLIGKSELLADTPILVAAREQAMIDTWLRLSQETA